jgi:DnaK suppressor protein
VSKKSVSKSTREVGDAEEKPAKAGGKAKLTNLVAKKTTKKASAKKAATKKAAASASKKKTAASKKTEAKKAAAAKTKAKTTAKSPADTAKSASKADGKATAKKKSSAKTTAKARANSAEKAAASKKADTNTVKEINSANETGAKLPVTGLESEVENDEELEAELSSSGSGPAVVRYERDGHYMDDEQLRHFSRKLAEWKQQLMEEVDRTVGHMKDDATNFPDPNDRATQEEEFSLELRTRDRERKLIKKINEAQKRIDDDEYGYCETCGIEIGVSRLEARPTAELCIDCKTLEEIRERQTA